MSKTMPVSLSRKLLEEHNNNSNSNKSAFSSCSSCSSSPSSPRSYNSYSSRSISPEPSFDSTLSGHSLHRKPTFSYIPIDSRRRSLVFSRSTSFNSISTSVQSLNLTTPESEVPSTPTSLYSSTSDHSIEYTSFPNLEKFDDECWTEIRIEKNDTGCDIEMESYDEMFVAGVRVHSS